MKRKIRGCLIFAAVAAAVIFPILTAYAGDALELYQMLPENIDSFVYIRDLKTGLSPFLSSDYYDEVGDLSLLEGPIKDDLTAPLISRFGKIEEDTGIRPTLCRVLWLIGERAVLYRSDVAGAKASAALLRTGRFRGFLIDVVSLFSGHITEEDWGNYSVWVASVGDKKLFYRNERGYTIISDSRDLLKSQLEIISGQNPRTLSGNSQVMNRLSNMPKDYHILSYSTRVMNPDPSERGLLARAGRLLMGTDALLTSVTFTETGADLVVWAPYGPGDARSGLADLGTLSDKASVDLSTIPGETAVLVVFRAFDPRILYTHFGKTWFIDVPEMANYISILNKWKEKGGFDFEGGIINNLGGGATAALVGIGYEAQKPYLKTIASVGIAPEGEATLSENLSKMYTYSFFDTGPQTLTFGPAAISYMGEFRAKSLDWNGSSYVSSVKANTGFSLVDNRLFLFWDLSTMERIIDLGVLASMTDAKGLFDRDFLAKSPSFIEAQKGMPADQYDLSLYVDGNNLMSLFENYLVNLSANYNYFLYQDSEKRLIPLLELTRTSFVSLYGGINFGPDAIQGTFKLSVKDMD